MDNLYITSARAGLSEYDLKAQPLAGSLFVIKKSGFTGMKGFEFNG
jgi:sugar lactone lactonase YvrE